LLTLLFFCILYSLARHLFPEMKLAALAFSSMMSLSASSILTGFTASIFIFILRVMGLTAVIVYAASFFLRLLNRTRFGHVLHDEPVGLFPPEPIATVITEPPEPAGSVELELDLTDR